MSLFDGLSAFPITPTDAAGRVDTDALARILTRIRDAKVHSIGLLGSTGGYAFLNREERRRAVDCAMDTVGGEIPVIVGVGALRTDEAQALARDAKAAGANGLLLAPVSYTPLRDDEVYAHFVAVAEAGQLPMAIYNNPGATRFTFPRALIARLAQLPNVVAVKMPLPDGDDFAGELAAIRAATPASFKVGYSGDWGCAAALLAGSDTWYSVIAGLLPGETLALAQASLDGDSVKAGQLNAAFAPLWALFKEFGSFRVMFVIAELLELGRFAPPLPILPLDDDARARIKAALDGLQVQ
jgi:4-hydroxy-tetrahydrodipicolinate synthase